MALIDPLLKPKVGPDGKPLLGITPPSDVAGKIPAVTPTGKTIASMTAPDTGIVLPPVNPFMPQQSGTNFASLSNPLSGQVTIAPPIPAPVAAPGPLPGGLTGEEFKTFGDAMGATNRPPEAPASPELLKTIVPPMQMTTAGVVPTQVPVQPSTIASNAGPAHDAATPGVGFIKVGANRMNLTGTKSTEGMVAPGMDFVKNPAGIASFSQGASGDAIRAGLGIVQAPNPADAAGLARTSTVPGPRRIGSTVVGAGVSDEDAQRAAASGASAIYLPEQPLPGESQEDFTMRKTAEGAINHGTPEEKARGMAALETIASRRQALQLEQVRANNAATIKSGEWNKDMAVQEKKNEGMKAANGHFETDAETGEQIWVTGRDTTHRTIGTSSGDASIYKRKADALDTAKANLDAFLYDKEGMPKSEPWLEKNKAAFNARKAMLEKAVQDAEAEVQAQESGGIRGRVGTAQAPTASEEPVRVSSPTDPAYLRLPAGAKYIGPDGKVAMKRAA